MTFDDYNAAAMAEEKRKRSDPGIGGVLFGAMVGGWATGGSAQGIVDGARIFGSKDGAAQVYAENQGRLMAMQESERVAADIMASIGAVRARGAAELTPSGSAQPYANAYDQHARDRAANDAGRVQVQADRDAAREAESRAFAASPAANQGVAPSLAPATAVPRAQQAVQRPAVSASGSQTGGIIVRDDRAALQREAAERSARDADLAAQTARQKELDAENARVRAEAEAKARNWKPKPSKKGSARPM